jgi:rubrerythrin
MYRGYEPREPKFVYDGRDKTKWNKLIRLHEEELAKRKISYITNPEILQQRRQMPVRQPILPVPPHENKAAENIRVTTQRRADDDYKMAYERYLDDTRKIQEAFATAITVITSFCTEEIIQDVYSTIRTPEMAFRSAEQQYHVAMQRLRDSWGPRDQTDVEALRKQLINIDGDEKGFEKAILKFDNLVYAMEQTPKRGADGNIEYQEVRPVFPPPLPAGATEEEQQAWNQQVGLAYAAALAQRGPPKNHRPTEEQLKEYILRALGKSKQSAYRGLSIDALREENRHWTYASIRQNILNIARKQDIEDGGRYKRKYESYEPKGAREASHERRRSYSQERSYRDSPRKDEHANDQERSQERSASAQSREGRYGKMEEQLRASNTMRCNNCGQQSHIARDCPEKKCGICGATFNTASERKTHWMDTHRKHVTLRLARGDRRSASPKHDGRERSRSRSNSRSPGRTPSYRRNHYSGHSGYGSEDTTEDF